MTLELVTVKNTSCTFDEIKREIDSPVGIGVAFDISKGKQEPFPGDFKAIWDTGATGTSVAAGIPERLGLQEVGEMEIHGVTGKETCKLFFASLHLPNGVVIPQIEVAELPYDVGCTVLIGMDVITMGDFAITNLDGKTTFTFRIPSIERIDFVKQRPPSPKIPRNDPCPCGSGKKFKKCHGV